MKRYIRLLAALLAATLSAAIPAAAQDPQLPDSLETEQLQQAVVSAVRSSKDAPFAVSEIGREKLESFSATGKELPMLLSRTPGVLSWSENGVGTGTTYLRIRGAGGSRINVTLDGVPLNSPEDQTVFWANMNSYSSLLGSIQVQRGVGSSTNGDGAFGGTISLATKAPSLSPSASVEASYGSWNTRHVGVSASSGLLFGGLVVEGAWHDTATDGFVHGTAGRSGSWLGSVSYLGSGFKFSYKILGNYETTGQAWNGVTAGTGDLSIMDGTYGEHTGIRTYEDMWNKGLGRYNSLYERMIISNGFYTAARYEMSDGSYWPRTTDNFWQTHHILNFSSSLGGNSRLSVSAHYTPGHGWYDEFRYGNKLLKYGISPFRDPTGATIKRSDFVRRKGLTQDTWGLVGSFTRETKALSLAAGVSFQSFTGNHYGYLTYAGNAAVRSHLGLDAEGSEGYKYYDSDATKLDGSAFAKLTWRFAPGWSAFGDLQYRHVRYRTDGYNDKYIDNGDGTASRHYLDIDENWNFLNPKAGVNFSSGAHRAFFSVALSHREPERNNFTDNGSYPYPKSESLLDFELGWQYNSDRLRLGAGLYYMRYRDQLVQTGQVSDIGEALTTNIPDSYRAGIELTAALDLGDHFTIEGNAALSRNRLLDFDEYVEDWDNGTSVIHYDDAPLAFSPSSILNFFADYHSSGFKAVWHTGYVSRIYLDNSGNEERSLPQYSLSSLSLSYTFHPRRVVRDLEIGLDADNLFSARVAQSGWVYSAICESYGHPDSHRYYQIGFVPVAPLSLTARLAIRF